MKLVMIGSYDYRDGIGDALARVLSLANCMTASWRGDLYVASSEGLHVIQGLLPGLRTAEAVVQLVALEPMKFVIVHNDLLFCGDDRGHVFVVEP